MTNNDNVTALLTAAENALNYMATDVVYCNGMKCREQHCVSCYGEEWAEEAVGRARVAYQALSDAIRAMR